MTDELTNTDPWLPLRRFTSARIGLGRAGDSLPTPAMLAFQLDHARARDAVHLPFDAGALTAELAAAGHTVINVQSAAVDRSTYLRRPDLGRRLNDAGRAALAAYAAPPEQPYDAALVIADGLSALAAHRHAAPLVTRAAAALSGLGWRIAPIVVACQGRVALGDEIGALLHARQVAIFIGERPGLTAADSLGIYLTYEPRPGRTDAERNCISNIHGGGQSYEASLTTLLYLMSEARRQRLTGVALKDDQHLAMDG